MIRLAVLLWILAWPAAAQLVQEAPEEARVRALAATLRCPVCQSESILESQAATAREMMVLLREQMAEGASDAEIVDFFRSRYGDFVTLAPPPTAAGRAIWALPPVLLLAGGLIWARSVRPRRALPEARPLDEARLREMQP